MDHPIVLAFPTMRTRLTPIFLLAIFCLSHAQTHTKINVFATQEGFVDSHGALIYYMSVGHGAPLLIVHGGPGAFTRLFAPLLIAAHAQQSPHLY